MKEADYLRIKMFAAFATTLLLVALAPNVSAGQPITLWDLEA